MKKIVNISFVLTMLLLVSCGTTAKKDITQKIDPGMKEPETVVETVEGNANYRVGQFTYFADAAVFKDCTINESHNVMPKAGIFDESEIYMKLEKYYRENAEEPGKPIYIEIQGYNVPKAEGEEGWDNTIVPNKFNIIKKEDTNC